MAFGIISGTSIYDLPGIEMEKITLDTKYGETVVYKALNTNQEIFFLPRHGITHNLPPHKINYRANIKALEQLGVKYIFAAYAVGSINRLIPPHSLVLLKDFIDFTKGRVDTFFDGPPEPVHHTDMSEVYSGCLSERLIKTAAELNIELFQNGIYVCTNGPRFETPAEIRMYHTLGADVVGMTGVPEVTLANELGIPFAAIGFSTNWAAGIEKSIIIEEQKIGKMDSKQKIVTLFLKTINTFNQ